MSAAARTNACLDRIAERDGLIQAWAYLDADRAKTIARALDQSGESGPLQGVPIGIKDVFLTRDMPTQYNAPQYRGFAPAIDATCVAILRQAGAVLLGKTSTVEFAATGRKPPTRNPHDPARTPGGSSSGSAAAVADGHVPIALGTQTGGSILRPASFCGVYGFKPTWGLVSNEGARSFSPSLDTVGWFARSADDLASIHDIFDPALSPEPPFTLSGSRIAFCRTPFWARAEPGTVSAFAQARRLLEAAGAAVTDLDLPSPFETLIDVHTTIMYGEARRSFLGEYMNYREALDPAIAGIAENAAAITPARLLAAYDTAATCRASFDKIAGAFDAVVAPSATGEAPLGLASTGDYSFNAIWTLLHVPCVNVPGLQGPSFMPVGMTVTGARFRDRKLLAIARAVGEVIKDSGKQVLF